MAKIDIGDTDLSKVPMCIMRLCGIIASPGPPTCDDRDDCPGIMWKILHGKEVKKTS